MASAGYRRLDGQSEGVGLALFGGSKMYVEQIQLKQRSVLGTREFVRRADLAAFIDRGFKRCYGALAQRGVEPEGPPIAIYRGNFAAPVDVTAAVPVGAMRARYDGLDLVMLPSGPALTAVHTGPHESLPAAYRELIGWMRSHGKAPAETMWEEYLVGPESNQNSAAWRTRIVWPFA